MTQQSVDPGLAFRTAANDGDVSQLEKLCSEDPTLLNQPGTKSGKTALHFAVSSGRRAAIKWLIEQGANIHVTHEKHPTTPYELGLQSSDPEIVQLFLEAGFNALTVTDKTNPQGLEASLSEGTVALLDFKPIGDEFKSHLKASLSYAIQMWKSLKLEGSNMPMPIAIQLLHTRIEHYFATENRRDYTYPGPNGSRNALAMHLMAMILTLQKSDRGFFKSLEQDESLSQAFSNLCFMHALVLYEEVAAVCIRNSHPSTAERGKIISDLLICNSSMKRADFFYKGCKDVEANSQYTQLQKQLIRNIYILRSTYEPQYMGFKELAAHVARKNVLSAKRKNNYHAQLIYNLDIHRQCKADSVVVQSLIDAMKNIKTGEQPRTQFIIDVIGNGHGLLTDVSFNQETCEFEIVCVDPGEVTTQHQFLDLLQQALEKQQWQFKPIIAIQTGLIKDMSSCHTFSLAMSGPMSRLSYAQLSASTNVPQPMFMNGRETIACAQLSKVIWRDVVALGQKVMMMDQSAQGMAHLLKPYYENNEGHLEKMIKGFLESYQLPPTVPVYLTSNAQQTYIHARRYHLRQRLKANPYHDLSFSASQVSMLLGHKAMGVGPQREFEALLNQHPDKINERNPSDGSTPLHWAYKTDSKNRIALLKEHGAKEDIADSKGLLPMQWRNKQG